MVQFGNAFTFSDVYSMPTHLRTFYYKRLVEAKKKEAEEYKKSNSSQSKPKLPKVRVNR